MWLLHYGDQLVNSSTGLPLELELAMHSAALAVTCMITCTGSLHGSDVLCCACNYAEGRHRDNDHHEHNEHHDSHYNTPVYHKPIYKPTYKPTPFVYKPQVEYYCTYFYYSEWPFRTYRRYTLHDELLQLLPCFVAPHKVHTVWVQLVQSAIPMACCYGWPAALFV